ETGGHVGHQIFAFCVRKGFELGAVDGVVLTDVYVIGVLVDRQIGAVRNIGEGLILGGSDLHSLAVAAGFLICLLCPLAGHDVIGYAVFHQVHRNSGELLGRAALQEQNLIVIRNV